MNGLARGSNDLQYPMEVVCLVVLWRHRYKLSLCDLAEMFLHRGIVLTHEAVRDWERKLAGSVANFNFGGKIRTLGIGNSMTCRLQNSRKSKFATEQEKIHHPLA
jgi:hypothetical protein